jgi:hypothetical protein
MDNNFSNFVNNLKGNNKGIHLDLDITWDIPNLLLNSNELLLLILTKTSMIPFADNYISIAEELGLTNEQALSLQESNEMILMLHTMIQQYCIKQFSIGSMMKAQMDNIILSAPEIKDVQSINDLMVYMQNYQAISSLQSGGETTRYLILSYIAYMILYILIFSPLTMTEEYIPEINKSNKLQLVINGNNVIQPYNEKILKLSMDELYQVALQSQPVKSRIPIKTNRIIEKYDIELKNQQTKLITQFMSLFQSQQEGIEFLREIINKFNSGLTDFSIGAEKVCFELMNRANDKGIFKSFMGFDDLDETKQKIDEIERNVTNYNSQLTERTMNVTMATVATTAISLVATGDISFAINEALPYILELGSSLYDSLSNTKKVVKETQLAIQTNTTRLSTQEKMELENKIYQLSKLYCSFGYNLQLELNGTEITIIGGNIQYNWLLSVVALLENNIDFKITSSSMNKDLNRAEISSLVSLKQRLEILKEITQKLSDIINFSMYSHISKLYLTPRPETLDKIEQYFDDQLQELLNMLGQVNKMFPKREKKIKEGEILLQYEKQLDKIEDDIKLKHVEAENERQQRQNEINQILSEMKSKNISASWVAFKTIAQSYVNIGLNTTDFIGKNLGDFTRSIGNIGLNVPLGFANSIFDFLNKIMYLLITNPSGWLLLGSGFIFFTFWFGGITGIIRIFKKSGEIFVTITYGSIMFIYKIIKTPFGYIYKKRDVIAIPQIKYTQEETEAASALLQLNKGSIGGRKTRHHKKRLNKTKQNKKSKNNKNKTKKKNFKKNRYSMSYK